MELSEKQLNRLKAIELEMLMSFIEVCKELDLKYYLLGGTLLGAVRHKGFIPWDDDIDIGMPRKDYEVFISKAQNLLPVHLFVQTFQTDPQFPSAYCKIRNSNTTFLETAVKKINMNHGVFIDVFPLDFYPDRKYQQKWFDWKNRILSNRIEQIFCSKERLPLKSKFYRAVVRIMVPSYKKALKKKDRLYKSVAASTCLANFSGAWGKKEIVPYEWYSGGSVLDFEGIKVNCPLFYNEWLTQVYGDYMQLPPIEKRKTHHCTEVVDFDKPYTEYMTNK